MVARQEFISELLGYVHRMGASEQLVAINGSLRPGAQVRRIDQTEAQSLNIVTTIAMASWQIVPLGNGIVARIVQPQSFGIDLTATVYCRRSDASVYLEISRNANTEVDQFIINTQPTAFWRPEAEMIIGRANIAFIPIENSRISRSADGSGYYTTRLNPDQISNLRLQTEFYIDISGRAFQGVMGGRFPLTGSAAAIDRALRNCI